MPVTFISARRMRASQAQEHADNPGRTILTDDGDKLYNYDELGRLTLVESALNSNVFLGGMALRLRW